VERPVIEPGRETWTVTFLYDGYDRMIENPTYDPINNLVVGVEVSKLLPGVSRNMASQDFKSYKLPMMVDPFLNMAAVTHDELAERLYNG
jgi:hypothetical protein